MFLVYILISGAIILFDQWVKWWTVQTFELGESKTVIENIFSLTYIRNTGAAWSILEGKMWLFTLITLVAVLVIGYLFITHYKKGNIWFLTGLTLIFAGAIGNFIDRVRLGYVIDMFQTDFINFPIFNVADVSLVIGVCCMFVYIILDERENKIQ